MKKKLIILSVILVLIFTACGNQQERPNPRGQLETNQSSIFDMARIEYCKINNDNTEVKSGFGNQFENIGTLNQNDIVKVLDQIGDWYAIQLDDNQVGAIPTYVAQPVVREDPQQTPAPDQQRAQVDPQQDIIGIPTDEQQQPVGDTSPRPARENDPLYDSQFSPSPIPNNRIVQPDTEQNPPTGQDLTPPETTRTPNTTEEPPGQATERQQPETAGGRISGLTEQEQQMVDLVNRDRLKNDLPALEVDLELTRVARIKSQDMVDQNYFSHYSPTYGSPFEMMDSFGINYLHAGENLAGNNNVQNAHTALMNSSGHRKNILSPNFTHIGIGVKPSDQYGYIYTQMFISKPR